MKAIILIRYEIVDEDGDELGKNCLHSDYITKILDVNNVEQSLVEIREWIKTLKISNQTPSNAPIVE